MRPSPLRRGMEVGRAGPADSWLAFSWTADRSCVEEYGHACSLSIVMGMKFPTYSRNATCLHRRDLEETLYVVMAGRESKSQRSERAQRSEHAQTAQIYVINLDHGCEESDARQLVVSMFKTTQFWRGRGSWCNTIPSSWGSMITLKFDSGYMSFLPRRWVPKIGYLC